jgi:hypothetical protein
MTGMMIFNLIAAIAVVGGLETVCRTDHVVAGRSTEEPSLWKPRLSERVFWPEMPLALGSRNASNRIT